MADDRIGGNEIAKLISFKFLEMEREATCPRLTLDTIRAGLGVPIPALAVNGGTGYLHSQVNGLYELVHTDEDSRKVLFRHTEDRDVWLVPRAATVGSRKSSYKHSKEFHRFKEGTRVTVVKAGSSLSGSTAVVTQPFWYGLVKIGLNG